MARTKYKGDLAISQDLKLGVTIYTLTAEESFPTSIKFNKDAEQSAGLDSCKVYLKRDYFDMDSTNKMEIHIHCAHAYFYGKRFVRVKAKN
jgi:hypothetical protein